MSIRLSRGPGRASAAAVFTLLLLSCPRKAPPLDPGLAGDWTGYLDNGGIKLLTVIRIEAPDPGSKGGYRVSALSPMQSDRAFAGSLSRGKGTSLRFVFEDLKASYVAEPAASGKSMSGSWTQRGKKLALELAKAEGAFVFSRPQEPKPPFPYEVEDLRFANEAAGISLAGTLSYPRGGRAKAGIVLVTGSGPQNRDEEILGHKPFLLVSDRLVRAGYAVLRYDDRGTGKSEGDFASATTFDMLSDAQAALTALRGRSELRTGAYGILGHSEGGLIAALLAGDPGLLPQGSGRSAIDFAVLLAGPAFPGDELLIQQSEAILLSQGAGKLSIAAAERANREIYDIVKSRPLGAEMRKELKRALLSVGVFGKNADAQAKSVMTPWFKTFLGLDPGPSLRSARVPLLALYGSKDIQVPCPANSDKMRAELAASGRKQSKVIVLEGLNHLFQKAAKGTLAEYGILSETMNDAVFDAMIPWLDARAGK